MSKGGFIGILLIVAWVHWLCLHVISIHKIQKKAINNKSTIHIRLATLTPPLPKPVTIPKPKHQIVPLPQIEHQVEPIILPPDPIEPKRIIQEKALKKINKPHKKKQPRKKHRKRHIRHKRVAKVVKKIEPQVQSQPLEPQHTARQQLRRAKIDTVQKAHYLALIRQRIKENLYYPRAAKRMHIQGIVQVAFRVSSNGEIRSVRVLGAPNRWLSEGAKRTLESISLPPIPAKMGVGHLELTIPIEFKLKG